MLVDDSVRLVGLDAMNATEKMPRGKALLKMCYRITIISNIETKKQKC